MRCQFKNNSANDMIYREVDIQAKVNMQCQFKNNSAKDGAYQIEPNDN